MKLLPVLLLVLAVDSGAVLVMPPEGRSAPGDTAWVGEAVSDALSRALARLAVPAVQRDDRLRAQDALDIPPVPLTRASSIRLAEAVGAGRLVVGWYEVRGPELSLSLRVLDTQRGTLSAPFLASGPIESILVVVQGLAWDIALSGPARPALSRAESLQAVPAVSFAAFRTYAQALAATDAAQGQKLLRQALAREPSFVEARLALARLLLQTREHDAARETLAHVPPASPVAREARFLQGLALLELGHYREASHLYSQLVEERATAAALNNHAVALLRLGGASGVKASQVFRKALELEPASADLPFNLGWALLYEGDAGAAAFWMEGVAHRDPRDVPARLVLAWALRGAGRVAEADEHWRGLATAASPFDPVRPDLARRFERVMPSERPVSAGRSDAERAAGHAGRAERHLQAGEAAAAIQELTRAVYHDPYNPRVHLLLSRAHRAGGETEAALAELRMSLWCRDDVAVRLELSRLLADLGRVDEARTEAERVLQVDPGNDAARRLVQAP